MERLLLAISQDVVENLKDYIFSLMLSNFLSLEHIGAKLCPSCWLVFNEHVHG